MVFVRIRYGGKISVVPEISKMATVRQLMKEITDLTDLPGKEQRLFFGGKELDAKYTLFDYNIDRNKLIEVHKRVIVDDVKKDKVEDAEGDSYSDKENEGVSVKPAETTSTVDDAAVAAAAADEPCEKCRKNPLRNGRRCKDCAQCLKCLDDSTVVKCKECTCQICFTKTPDRNHLTLMCDECEYFYHTFCLDPPLETIPDDDWYCPQCKNDEDEIVRPGQKLKIGRTKANMPSMKNKSKRDWGGGMATTGRSKTCTKVPSNHFGPIPGVEVGMCWKYRIQISEEGLHRPPVAGIAGKPVDGAYSIVLAGGYEDDIDHGDEFTYTGAGGRDLSGNKRTAEQSFDQELTKTNLAIAVNCDCPINDVSGGKASNWKKGKACRVIRTEKFKKHSKFAPDEGCRYDGVYKVVEYWPEKGQSGLLVWRYRFRRDDPSPAPWTEAGKKIIAQKGYECIFPEGYAEAQAAKAKKAAEKGATGKGNKGKGKGKGRKRKISDEEEEGKKEGFKESGTPSNEGSDSAPVSSKRTKTRYEIADDWVALIKTDEDNAATWKEILEKEYEKKLDFTDEIEKNFRCPICQSLPSKPVTTTCGHNMCGLCLKHAMSSSEKNCVMCRSPLEKEVEVEVDEEDEEDGETKKVEVTKLYERNGALQDALMAIFPGYDNES